MRNAFFQCMWLVLLATVAAGFTAWLHPRAPDYQASTAARSPFAITWDEASVFPAVLWIDARSAEDFAQGHAPAAILLNEDIWNTGLDEVIMRWSPEEPIIVYCDAAACRASEAVALRLRRELGADNIYYLEGGWQTWQAQLAR